MLHRKFTKAQLQGGFYVILFLGFLGMFISSAIGLMNHQSDAAVASRFGAGAESLLGTFVFSGLVCSLLLHGCWRKLVPVDPEAAEKRLERRFIKAWKKAEKKQPRSSADH